MATQGKGFWKFNNYLFSNAEYVEKMKNQIAENLCILDQDKYLRWEYLKYEIRKLTMNFSKNLLKEENKYRNFLQKEQKNRFNFQINHYFLERKQKLQNIHTKKVNGISNLKSQLNSF